jgi:methionine aminotransferase
VTVPLSKLPHIGTTIFTTITDRARQLGAINLAQGFPDYDPPELLKQLAGEQVMAGRNQYAPMMGVAELREQIAIQVKERHGWMPHVDTEITITLGATEAIFSGIQALVHPGDEVILFDPAYDSYAPAVLLAGGVPVHIALQPPHFRYDWDLIKNAFSAKTRLVIINTPHNPTATVATTADFIELEKLVSRCGACVLCDEVYEHMVYDGREHVSVLSRQGLRERAIAVYSFGKSMHATGWRVGYAIAPAEITRELRRVHQFNTFSISTPLQYAIAEYLRRTPGHNAQLSQFYEAKRDYFLQQLHSSSLRPVPSQGTYFQLLDFSACSDMNDVEFADVLLRQAGVASIPLSPFYAKPIKLSVLRFCFAKQKATLAEAARKLSTI